MLCHFVLISRTICVLCCIMLSWSLEQKMFCVVSCCLDYDTNLILKFSEICYFVMLCPSNEIETNSRKRNFIFNECFMLYHVVMISRTKCVLCCVILSWSIEQTVFMFYHNVLISRIKCVLCCIMLSWLWHQLDLEIFGKCFWFIILPSCVPQVRLEQI